MNSRLAENLLGLGRPSPWLREPPKRGVCRLNAGSVLSDLKQSKWFKNWVQVLVYASIPNPGRIVQPITLQQACSTSPHTLFFSASQIKIQRRAHKRIHINTHPLILLLHIQIHASLTQWIRITSSGRNWNRNFRIQPVFVYETEERRGWISKIAFRKCLCNV